MLQNPSITLVDCRVKTANSRTVAAMFKMRSLRAVVIFRIVPLRCRPRSLTSSAERTTF